MAFGAAKSGHNGLVYLSGAELEGANAWSVAINKRSAEYIKFGDTWVTNLPSVNDWAGTLGAVHDQDAKKIQTAVTATVAVALLIYPDRGDLTTYYDGSAIFSFSSDASVAAVVSQASTFLGTGTLTLTGFA